MHMKYNISVYEDSEPTSGRTIVEKRGALLTSVPSRSPMDPIQTRHARADYPKAKAPRIITIRHSNICSRVTENALHINTWTRHLIHWRRGAF